MKNVITIDRPACLKCSRFTSVLDGVGFIKTPNQKKGGEPIIHRVATKEFTCGPEVNPNCPAATSKLVIGVNPDDYSCRILSAETEGDADKLGELYTGLTRYDPEIRTNVMDALSRNRLALTEAVTGPGDDPPDVDPAYASEVNNSSDAPRASEVGNVVVLEN